MLITYPAVSHPGKFYKEIPFLSDLFEQLLTRSGVWLCQSLPKITAHRIESVCIALHIFNHGNHGILLASFNSVQRVAVSSCFQCCFQCCFQLHHLYPTLSFAWLQWALVPAPLSYGVLAAEDVVLCCTLQHRVDHHGEIGPQQSPSHHFHGRIKSRKPHRKQSPKTSQK